MFTNVLSSLLKLLVVEIVKFFSSWVDDILFKKQVEKMAKEAEKEREDLLNNPDVEERRKKSLDFLNRDRN